MALFSATSLGLSLFIKLLQITDHLAKILSFGLCVPLSKPDSVISCYILSVVQSSSVSSVVSGQF